MISQSMPLIVMAICLGRSSLDLVELVLDVDVFALAPCASVDCMLELLVRMLLPCGLGSLNSCLPSYLLSLLDHLS